MTQRDWARDDGHLLGVFFNGAEVRRLSQRGRRLVDDSFVLLFNAHHELTEFTLPPRRFGGSWALELSTAAPGSKEETFAARGRVPVEARSLVVLRSPA
jgi:glycogen operon protein